MALSPMMQMYLETKKEYPDCILFYRLGDFYEMFFEDAEKASKVLGLTLTGKTADWKTGHLCAGYLIMPLIPI